MWQMNISLVKIATYLELSYCVSILLECNKLELKDIFCITDLMSTVT